MQFNIDAGDDVVVDEENIQARKQGQPAGNAREVVVAQTPTKSAKEKKSTLSHMSYNIAYNITQCMYRDDLLEEKEKNKNETSKI